MSRGEDRRIARETQSDMKRFYYIFGAVAVIGIGVVGFNVGNSMLSSAVTAPVDLDLADDGALVELAQGVTLGDPEAQVTVVEFGDYQCPGCGAFALSVKPQLEGTLVASGEVKFVYYDFPLISIHPNAFLAARAARCSGEQDSYWEYHETLFRNQSRWAAATMPASAFEDYAEEVGMDGAAFEACLNSEKYADVVTANMELGARMQVNGTPTVMVNANGETRTLFQNDFQTISSVINEMTASEDGSN
ncbi:MAG: disulfide bond formation protein DsbA [Gemmatimonadetes bacterium]|nr:disulfide bond formation protein DsbA [Gemmatimonadota bacterium]